MQSSKEVIDYINTLLRVNEVKDHCPNGLQVEGSKEVNRIAFGVSASLKLIKKAIKDKADMIIVHHGLLWQSHMPKTYTGYYRERIATLLKHNTTLLGYHLPLDMHFELGNNAQILSKLDAVDLKPFGKSNGQFIGYKGMFIQEKSLKQLLETLNFEYGIKPHIYDFGKENIQTIACVSGGGADLVYDAINDNIDLFITGESKEYTQELCREAQINFVNAGHYNSEKAGIKALMEHVQNRFNIDCEFIDIPNIV